MNKKTIWITGGSTGIGKALAIKFASKGWNVAVSARRKNLLKEIRNEYKAKKENARKANAERNRKLNINT